MDAIYKQCIAVASCLDVLIKIFLLLEELNFDIHTIFGNNQHLKNVIKLMKDILPLRVSYNNMLSFTKYGHVLFVYHELLKNEGLIECIKNCIGSIDTYISIGKFFYNQTAKNQFCFVDYDETATSPFIDAKDVNFLLLDSDIKETILMGVFPVSGKFLITGPNGSGKSIFLKRIGQLLLFAQSFGIAPATYCILTPFLYIQTSFNAIGDTSKNLSKFFQQIEELNQFKNEIAKQNSRFCLLLVDEMLNGTIEREAAARIVDFGLNVQNANNAIIVITTHLELPKTLEEKTSKNFQNYHMDITYKNGKFINNFHIVQGPADWWFNSEKLSQEYINMMVKEKSL